MTKQRLGFEPSGDRYGNVGYVLAKDGRVVCAVCDPRQVYWAPKPGNYQESVPLLGGVYNAPGVGDLLEEVYKQYEAIAAFEDGTPLCCSECGGSMLWRDIDHTGAGDYSGHGTVERSNCLAIASHLRGLEEGKDEPDWPEENKHWREETGAYGYLVLQAQLMAESKDVHPAIKDIEAALANYPLFDDQHHSEYEFELEKEALPEALHDFWKDLGKRCSALEDESPEFLAEWARLDEEDAEETEEGQRVIAEWFHSLADQAGVQWLHEGPESTYIDTAKMANAVTAWDLRELLEDIEEALKKGEETD